MLIDCPRLPEPSGSQQGRAGGACNTPAGPTPHRCMPCQSSEEPPIENTAFRPISRTVDPLGCSCSAFSAVRERDRESCSASEMLASDEKGQSEKASCRGAPARCCASYASPEARARQAKLPEGRSCARESEGQGCHRVPSGRGMMNKMRCCNNGGLLLAVGHSARDEQGRSGHFDTARSSATRGGFRTIESLFDLTHRAMQSASNAPRGRSALRKKVLRRHVLRCSATTLASGSIGWITCLTLAAHAHTSAKIENTLHARARAHALQRRGENCP